MQTNAKSMNAQTYLNAPRIDAETIREEKNALSEEERARVNRDKYGIDDDDEDVTHSVEHDEQVTQRSLLELETEINKVKHKPEYEEAMERCPPQAYDSVRSREFRLKMLRADSFDAKDAASRIVRYWTQKVFVWGKDIAFRGTPITLSDFSEADLRSLRLSSWRILPRRDKHGRTICVFSRPAWVYEDRKNLLRAVWYLLNTVVEDDTSQQKGMVLLAYDVGQFVMNAERKVDSMVIRVALSTPIRVVCLHHFTNDWFIKTMMPFVMFMLGQSVRHRTVFHNPNHVVEDLKEYGITEKELPQEMGGTLQFDFDAWLEERSALGL